MKRYLDEMLGKNPNYYICTRATKEEWEALDMRE